MALVKRGGVWYLRKMINGQVYRESTGGCQGTERRLSVRQSCA
jgi:hypothetical protein